MYVATMEYPLKAAASAAEAADLWKSIVVDAARERPGLVRLQLFSSPRSLLAVGTWQDKAFAEEFMRTGVFVRLTAALSPLLASDPQPRLWSEEAFVGA